MTVLLLNPRSRLEDTPSGSQPSNTVSDTVSDANWCKEETTGSEVKRLGATDKSLNSFTLDISN